ncbi:MAG: alpha/beta hydrolase [Candidatus Woesearchaeota archaeon]
MVKDDNSKLNKKDLIDKELKDKIIVETQNEIKDEVNEKSLSITNDSKEKLIGFLGTPKDPLKGKKLVIMCHGYTGHKNNVFFSMLSKLLNEQGYYTYRFDFAGNGESEGKFEESTITKEIEDIKSVGLYFTEKGYDLLSILGHSKGGTDVLMNQTKYHGAKSVVALAAKVYGAKGMDKKYSKEQMELLEKQGFFLFEKKGKIFKISKLNIDDRIKNYADIREKCEQILVPVLLVHGTNDITTPVDESKDLIKVLNMKSTLKTIEGADHNFTNEEHQKIMFNTITIFLSWVERGHF